MAVQKEKLIELYKKYAPHNITLERFAEMVEKDPSLLNDINGEFSTFDTELSMASKYNPSTDAFRQRLKDSIDENVAEQVALEYAKIYEKVICSDDTIIDDAIRFDDLSEEAKQDLARRIIQGANKYLNINSDLEVEYQDSYYGEEKSEATHHRIKFIDKFLNLFKRKQAKRVNYALGGKLVHWRKIHLYKKYEFIEFIVTLSHEYAHFIDYNYPDRGMLGAQIANYGGKIYAPAPHPGYPVNPTEFSSFYIEEIVGKHIQKVLIEQARKRLEILNVKLSGARFNFDKATSDLVSTKFKILEERNLSGGPWEQKKDLLDELEKDKSCPEVQNALNNWNQARKEYEELFNLVCDIKFMLELHDEQSVNTPSGERQM